MTAAPNLRLRRRVELAIRVASPVLDATLAALMGVSRLLARDESPGTGTRLVHTSRPARRGLRPGA